MHTKAYPNACVYRCELGGDASAWIAATGIRQDPKCRRQYNAVGWMTGMCLDCQLPRPRPTDRAACEKRCHRDAFAPLCARLGDGSRQAFENGCMFACYAEAEGDHSAHVVARDIQVSRGLRSGGWVLRLCRLAGSSAVRVLPPPTTSAPQLVGPCRRPPLPALTGPAPSPSSSQLPAKCENQWDAVGYMVGWCKQCPSGTGSRRMMRERPPADE